MRRFPQNIELSPLLCDTKCYAIDQMLCKICLNIDIDALTVNLTGTFNDLKGQPPGYKHHINFRNLFESAQQHCELCQQILNDYKTSSEYTSGRESFFDEQIYSGIANKRFKNPQLNRGGSELCFYWYIEGANIHIARLGLYIERSPSHGLLRAQILKAICRLNC